MNRFAFSALALIAFSFSSANTAHAASDRAIPRPPLVISPDVSTPWLLQMKPGKTKPVVTAPSARPIPASQKRSGNGFFKKRKPMVQKERTRSIAPQFLPQIVRYTGSELPGTIIIDTNSRHLYLVLEAGKAKRYGVGVGRPGFSWAGAHKITRKAEWPVWTPPPEMIAREAERGRILPASMEGGPSNPLGARALYLGDTLYRIHGSNEPWTIGHAVSSGCIRMRNEDVTDLYSRVDVGTRVLVR
jgi:lipoprotein-anchoring transpeptidase ErfK/SrfK